jgi:hypothetical protein
MEEGDFELCKSEMDGSGISASNVRRGPLADDVLVTADSDNTRRLDRRELRWGPAPLVGVVGVACPDMLDVGW